MSYFEIIKDHIEHYNSDVYRHVKQAFHMQNALAAMYNKKAIVFTLDILENPSYYPKLVVCLMYNKEQVMKISEPIIYNATDAIEEILEEVSNSIDKFLMNALTSLAIVAIEQGNKV